jgi:tripartite-type tricarboxylate transporter receptor subunit TctC
MQRRHILSAALAGATSATLGITGVLAQAYPSRPLKMIVPWPPGQATDLAGRVAAQELSKGLGIPVVIENKAGAGGTIGTDAVAKSPPDGYTILAASSGPMSVAPLLQKVPYDPMKDLAPVAMIGMSPYVLVTSPAMAAKDLREFITMIRSAPGRYSFGSSGTGATAHLIAEAFNSAAGLQALHVPYKGSVAALTDVIGGQITYCIETAASTMPLVKSGKLKAYGVSLEKGSTMTPGVMPFAKLPELSGFDLGAWLGVMVPTNTPAAIIDRLAGILEKSMPSEAVKQTMASISVEPDFRSAAELTAYLKAVSMRFADVIRRNNIKLT